MPVKRAGVTFGHKGLGYSRHKGGSYKFLRIFSKIPQAPAKNLCDDRRAVQRGPAWEAGPAAI